MVQRPALAIAINMSHGVKPRLARREQLLAGEFRRGMQVVAPGAAVRGREIGRKAADMGLVAGARLQGGGLDLLKIARFEPAPHSRAHAGAGLQSRPLVGINALIPPRGRGRLGLEGHGVEMCP
jgi:hypothetical protein